ncbi:MAG: 2'-5' RNA ligase family protein [Saprospiraceae bacterium]|nr:2'-5' RNA ligase family protein [Saprospiraceae bacterium]
MTRLQLTLFADEIVSENIEFIRRTFNPEQHALIGAHVTLCREDELEPLEKVMANLEALEFAPITIHFGKPVRFSDEKGVLLPAIGNNTPFFILRELVLNGVVETPRKHEPHLTLIHPRNATCTDAIFEKIQKIDLPESLTFTKISLIEQEMGEKWQVLKEFYCL